MEVLVEARAVNFGEFESRELRQRDGRRVRMWLLGRRIAGRRGAARRCVVAWCNSMVGSSVSVLASFSPMFASSDSSSGSAPKAWLHEVALAWPIREGAASTAVLSSAKLGSRALHTRPAYACHR